MQPKAKKRTSTPWKRLLVMPGGSCRLKNEQLLFIIGRLDASALSRRQRQDLKWIHQECFMAADTGLSSASGSFVEN